MYDLGVSFTCIAWLAYKHNQPSTRTSLEKGLPHIGHNRRVLDVLALNPYRKDCYSVLGSQVIQSEGNVSQDSGPPVIFHNMLSQQEP